MWSRIKQNTDKMLRELWGERERLWMSYKGGISASPWKLEGILDIRVWIRIFHQDGHGAKT